MPQPPLVDNRLVNTGTAQGRLINAGQPCFCPFHVSQAAAGDFVKWFLSVLNGRAAHCASAPGKERKAAESLPSAAHSGRSSLLL